jgi:hypothetical protein
MDVPFGQVVTIPGLQAARSKDLWRAIGQKLIVRVPGHFGTALPQRYPTPPTAVQDDVLQARVQFLDQRVKQLEAENEALRKDRDGLQSALQTALSQQDRLDSILSAIEKVKSVPVIVQGGVPGAVVRPTDEIADGAAPQFIPSEIAPKDASARIDVVAQEADDSGLSDAAGRLRKLRKGGDK